MRSTRPGPTMHDLYATLQGRHRPEDVATLIALLHPSLPAVLRGDLQRAARSYSCMDTRFAAPAPLQRPAQLLARLLDLPVPEHGDGGDAGVLRARLDAADVALHRQPGQPLRQRLPNAARRAARLPLSGRQYTRAAALVVRLRRHVLELEQQQQRERLLRFAKTIFASEIPYALFAQDVSSACFVAYYSANLGRRSHFTFGAQPQAFDTLAATLLGLAQAEPGYCAALVAEVFPRGDVLACMDDAGILTLLTRTIAVLQETALQLEALSERYDLDLATMVVRAGQDSSTWNAMAGAWNKARDYWIALCTALGRTDVFGQFLPGKVLRLMAADVVYGHAAYGTGDLHPDTQVWADLPQPWAVLRGTAACTEEEVAAACARHGVDAHRSGWIAARSRQTVVPWQPTPETVHGVVVANPELAACLRRIGVFAGPPRRRRQS